MAKARGSRRGSGRRLGAIAAAVALAAVACSWVPFDFNGDKKADVAWVQDSTPASATAVQAWWRAGETEAFHAAPAATVPVGGGSPAGYFAVPGDYDGNGMWEPATVLLPNGTTWETTGSRGSISFPPPALPSVTGVCGPSPVIEPVPADYDGDGKTDPAWYRETDGTWWIEGRVDPITFGSPWKPCPDSSTLELSYDLAVPADYDGDRKADLAVYDPVTRHWRVLRSSDGVVDDQVAAGPIGAEPVPADYDGDGKVDRASREMMDGIWHLPGRAPFTLGTTPSAAHEVIPAPANYDGNPGAEAAELDEASGAWRIDGQSTVWIGSHVSGSSVRRPVAFPAAGHLSMIRMYFAARDCDPRFTPPSNQPAFCSA